MDDMRTVRPVRPSARKRPAGLDVARGTQRRKRTGMPPSHGLQPLAHGVVPQKLGPRFPPLAPVPPAHGVQPPALDLAFQRHGLVPLLQGVEFSPHGPERPVHDPGILRLEGEREATGFFDN